METLTHTGGTSSGTFSFNPPFFFGVRPLKIYIQHKTVHTKTLIISKAKKKKINALKKSPLHTCHYTATRG
jgi:hypothetical protein